MKQRPPRAVKIVILMKQRSKSHWEDRQAKENQGLKDDLEKHAKATKMILNQISRLNIIVNCKDVQLGFDKRAIEWQNFQRAYAEYIMLSEDSKELHTIKSEDNSFNLKSLTLDKYLSAL